ncbi:MAG: polyprenyl synthetase family protein [Candidatus Zapsychrus exili]|nr:polyprenyl synthetase family protein [Candidatus Zapsychrus exili]
MIIDIKKQIDQRISSFLDKIDQEYKISALNAQLYKNIKEFSLRDGKRIRPILFILSYLGYSSPSKRTTVSLYETSIAIELLHNFMLIHDDIIDESSLRRNKPTMHIMFKKTAVTKNKKKLGRDLAIIAGDLLYAIAIRSFLSIKASPAKKERALKYFIETTAITAMGEFLDTINGFKSLAQIKEKDVMLNYTLKTSRYTFSCPLVTGAILSGAKESDIKKLSELGILIGQAFQIQDDIIGIFGNEKVIGKSILSDLQESKKTLLTAHAYKKLKKEKRTLFLKYFNKKTKRISDLNCIKKIFIDAGSLEYSLKEVESRAKKSLEILRSLRMKPTYKKEIESAIFQFFKQSKQVADKNNISLAV